MRLLAACSLGGAGHLQPLVPLLDAARRRGDETLVVGPPALVDMVGRTGHPFVAGGEPPETVVAPIREQLPVLPTKEASVLGNRELFGRLATGAMLAGVAELVADWAPDLVLRDPCEYASAIVACRRDLPCAQVAIGLADVEWGSLAVAEPALEEQHAGVTDCIRRAPYLSRFPASLDPSRFPSTVRYQDAEHEARPLPDWWHGSDAPLVYVTFGTVLGHMSIAPDVFRAVLGAVEEVDARVLLTVGRVFDVSALGPLPRHVHATQWVDQADVLAEAEVVVCHGGSGTTFGALRAGVPLVVVPLFSDQLVNARLVAGAGAGTVVAIDEAPRIAEAVRTVRAEPSFREHARRVGAEMRSAPTVDALLDRLRGGDTGLRASLRG